MNRPLALTVPVALAACFALTGCTIYTYSTPPPHKKPHAAAPKPATTGITLNKNGSTPAKPAGSGGKVTPSSDVPTVTASTIFGGSSVQAFHGFAYVIPEATSKMPNLTDMVPFGQLYTDQFNVSPQTFTGGFPGALLQDEWFALRYTGTILAPATTKWTFKLISDDGAILYIDGTKVIDNDGLHSAMTKTGAIDLTAGNHTLQLDYFQERKGSVALQLFAVVGDKDVPVTGIR